MAKKFKDITFTAHVSPDCSPETKKALADMLKTLAEQIDSDTRRVCPDCKGKGIVKDSYGGLFECTRCQGEGRVVK